ncbi:MAG: HAD family hydrolase [Solirubrobacterales bacterium]|nr:HAD family hydrolase [Solirubrobacterales bacterium]
MGWSAAVFDLFFTLAFPTQYPGGHDRCSWLARLTGINEQIWGQRWEDFEPTLERGAASARPLGSPEPDWVETVSREEGVSLTPEVSREIHADWDLAQREGLASPPEPALQLLRALRVRSCRLGLLSNTHALEVRTWPTSPLAPLFDAVGFSHQIGALKPAPGSYAAVLEILGTNARDAAYIGDGSSGELAGAKAAGFGIVILVSEAAELHAPHRLGALHGEADFTARHIDEVQSLLGIHNR